MLLRLFLRCRERNDKDSEERLGTTAYEFCQAVTTEFDTSSIMDPRMAYVFAGH